MNCHVCNKKIPTRLNVIKDPTYYFIKVQRDAEDRLYWCSWACIEAHCDIPANGIRRWLFEKFIKNKTEVVTIDFS